MEKKKKKDYLSLLKIWANGQAGTCHQKYTHTTYTHKLSLSLIPSRVETYLLSYNMR